MKDLKVSFSAQRRLTMSELEYSDRARLYAIHRPCSYGSSRRVKNEEYGNDLQCVGDNCYQHGSYCKNYSRCKMS